MKMLVQWKQKGNLVRGGIASPRHTGDEDIMDSYEARSHEVCGLVKILGPASAVVKVGGHEIHEDDDVMSGSELIELSADDWAEDGDSLEGDEWLS